MPFCPSQKQAVDLNSSYSRAGTLGLHLKRHLLKSLLTFTGNRSRLHTIIAPSVNKPREFCGLGPVEFLLIPYCMVLACSLNPKVLQS